MWICLRKNPRGSSGFARYQSEKCYRQEGNLDEPDRWVAALGLRIVGDCDCGLRRAARLASARRFSQRVAVDIRLGQIYRRGLVWECGNSRPPVRELVYGRGLQFRRGPSGVAVCRVGAVFLYGGDGGGRARVGGGVFFRQPGAELHVAAGEEGTIPPRGRRPIRGGPGLPPRGQRPVRGDPGVGGVVGRDAAGYQPVPVLLQPIGHSGAVADCADAGSAEPRDAFACNAAAGAGFGWDRPAVCADGADQNYGCLSGACGGVGDGAAARAEAEAGVALCAGRGDDGCRRVWPVDGDDCRFWPVRRLQILLSHCECLPEADGD